MFVCGQGAPKRILPIYFKPHPTSLTPQASPPTPLQGERGVKCKERKKSLTPAPSPKGEGSEM